MSLIEKARKIRESLNIEELKANNIFRTPIYYRIRVTYPPLASIKPRAREAEIFKREAEIFKDQLEGAVYIHYPFCPDKCGYCHFTTYKNPRGYIDILKRNIEMIDVVPTSLYFGGGTSTFMKPAHLKEFFSFLYARSYLQQEVELTVETRPDTLTDKILAILPTYRLRLNIGVQDFNDHVLRAIGRKPTSAQAVKAIKKARTAEVKHINIDLIYGCINQTLEDWERNLNIAIDLGVDSITTYQLDVAGSHNLRHKYPTGKEYEEQLERNLLMHIMSIEKFKEVSYIHDPIDWFIKEERFNYRHQQEKWSKQKNIIAFGPDVYWFINGYMGQNLPLDNYVLAIKTGRIPMLKAEKLSEEELIARKIGFGIKTKKGVDITELINNPLPYTKDVLLPTLENLTKLKLIEEDKGIIKLTYTGQLFADEIFGKFFTQETKNRLIHLTSEHIIPYRHIEYIY